VVTPEHRYYGKSSPFKRLATENLRFLSSKQALFDLAVFREYYQVGLPSCWLNVVLQKFMKLLFLVLKLKLCHFLFV
jgi:hypothetical protein